MLRRFKPSHGLIISSVLYLLMHVHGANIYSKSAVTNKYIVIAPAAVFPASNYTIFVSADPLQPDGAICQLAAEIQCHRKDGAGQNPVLYSQSLGNFSLNSGDSQRVIGLIPPFIVSENYQSCSLILKNKENGAEFERRDLVLSSSKSNAADSKVFFQLDKPAYKPLDTIRIRIIVLNKFNLPDLNPENITIVFSDPGGFTMQKWPNGHDNITMDQNGLINIQIPLGEEIVFGTWKITVSVNSQTVTKEFLIQRYVLPKFYLKFYVNPKPYITSDTTTISVDVHAMYTYKRALEGRLNVTLFNPKVPSTKSTKFADLTNGKAAFTFHPVNELGRNLVTEGAELQLLANVTEARTGRYQTWIHTIPVFVNDPFKITWLNPVRFYKPGIPLYLNFAISDYENMPVRDSPEEMVKLTTNVGGRTFQRISLPIGSDGTVKFLPGLPLPYRIKFDSIKVEYKNKVLDIPPPRPVVSTDQSADVYLHPTLDAKPEELRRGSNIHVNIQPTKTISLPSVSYILWSGQEIVGFRTGQEVKNGGISVNLPADETYAQLKLIVYANVAIGDKIKNVLYLKYKQKSMFDESIEITA